MGLFRSRKSKIKPSSQMPRRDVRVINTNRPDFTYYRSGTSMRPTPRDASGATSSQTNQPRSMLGASLETAHKPAKNRRRIIFLVLLIPILILLGQFLLIGTDGKVAMLQSDGTYMIVEDSPYDGSISEILRSSVLNRTKITLNTSKVVAELSRRHPEIESAALTMPIVGRTPIVYISQSEPVFNLQQGASYYTLSASGYITGVVTGDLTLPLVQDETGEAVVVGKRLLPRSHVKFMKTILYQFDHADIDVASLVLPADKAYEVDVRLQGKPYIVRFNLEEDAVQQSGAAIATIEQLGATTPASYLDVRVPGRVYYK